MIIRILIVALIFVAWAKLLACELLPETHRRTEASWPDAAVEPQRGRGGYFGRPDADVP